uniref:Uncharacterized protein n=1 Tax=Anguilla anguilla TaxID=7936 RepID=A0A0E9SN93_ANGAN
MKRGEMNNNTRSLFSCLCIYCAFKHRIPPPPKCNHLNFVFVHKNDEEKKVYLKIICKFTICMS